MKITDIDTVTQQFEAEILVRAKWMEPLLKGKFNVVFDPQTMWCPNLLVLNLDGGFIIDKHCYKVVHNAPGYEAPLVVWLWRFKGFFKENLELAHFPIDVQQEDISRLVPQKCFATTEGPGYLMQVSIMAAHSKFTAEYGRTVSLSKFAQDRPRNVRKFAMSHREYCVCVYCINVRYKLLSLSRAVMDPCKKKYSEGDIFDIVLCAKGDADSYHKPECINGTGAGGKRRVIHKEE
ncbi:unnamed protein product [Mytilus coruscus]|uniref:Uncharacterized protein n=1 Tax=Mytilus coruscus TaxID=42192 RepID=A0A6J8BJF6_MYTCO|nr:unnamed protein product [Mytilus coruscus]